MFVKCSISRLYTIAVSISTTAGHRHIVPHPPRTTTHG